MQTCCGSGHDAFEAQPMMFFVHSNEFRASFCAQDGMVVHHEVLENGDFSQRQQVVRWIRRFPFKFLSDREYTIARRMFTREDSLYGITKVSAHV